MAKTVELGTIRQNEHGSYIKLDDSVEIIKTDYNGNKVSIGAKFISLYGPEESAQRLYEYQMNKAKTDEERARAENKLNTQLKFIKDKNVKRNLVAKLESK